MPRTTTVISRADFVADPNSIERLDGGRQIDWANVGAGYIDATTGKKVLPGGTVLGDLLSTNKAVSPRVVTTNPAMGVLLTNANEADRAAGYTGYGIAVGGVLYETLMPDATGTPKTIAAAIKTELTAAGCTFKFVRYEDNRV